MSSIDIVSLVSPPAPARVDPYAINPLADDYLSVNAVKFSQARRRAGAPPKMFCDGLVHLPPITASGMDPTFLSWLPYGCRHYAAALPTEAEVHDLFQRHSADPRARFDHEGLDEAIARVRAWAFPTAPVAQPAPVAAPAKGPRRSSAGRRRGDLTPQAVWELSRRGEFLPRP